MKVINILLVVAVSSIPSISGAQICNDNIKSGSDSTRFVDLKNGYVLDVISMLQWDLCSLGQTYVDGYCIGSPTQFFEWQDALNAVSEIDGMRLPNIKELATLVERSCVEPAINQDIFPDTPLYVYWSNTPSTNGSGLIVDFTDGSEIIRDINRPRVVRMVRQ